MEKIQVMIAMGVHVMEVDLAALTTVMVVERMGLAALTTMEVVERMVAIIVELGYQGRDPRAGPSRAKRGAHRLPRQRQR